MRDDELRNLMAGYTAAPTPAAPTASQLRMASGRRRTLALGGGALGLAALGGVGALLAPPGRPATPLATPAPPAPTMARPVAATCADVAKAWSDALATPPAFPSALGTNPQLIGRLPDGTLLANADAGGARAAAAFPSGLAGPMVRHQPNPGEWARPVANRGNQVVFLVGQIASDGRSSGSLRVVVLDGPDAAARELARELPLTTWPPLAPFGIVGDRLRWFEFTTGAPESNLLVKELALAGPSPTPSVQTLGMYYATSPLVQTESVAAWQESPGAWRAVNLTDLSPADPPPGVSAVEPADNPYGNAPSRFVTFYTGHTGGSPQAWRYDSVTGTTEKIGEGLRRVTSYQNLRLERNSAGYRLRDEATGNSVAITPPEGLQGPIMLGEAVAAWTEGLINRDGTLFSPKGFAGAAVPIDTLPRSIPPC